MSAIEHAHDTLGKGHRIIAEQDKRARTMEAGVDLRQVERERESWVAPASCVHELSHFPSVYTDTDTDRQTHTHTPHAQRNLRTGCLVETRRAFIAGCKPPAPVDRAARDVTQVTAGRSGRNRSQRRGGDLAA